MKVLALNPGSTSTKVALSRTGLKWRKRAGYDADVSPKLRRSRTGRIPARGNTEMPCSTRNGLAEIDAVVGRGGRFRPIESGTYEVNDKMLSDVRTCKWGARVTTREHPLAIRASRARVTAERPILCNSAVVDELIPARYSGIPETSADQFSHALNQKTVARQTAEGLGKPYEECCLIIAHMGGGISVGAHDHGRVVDVNNALDGDGPFSPERAGSLPAGGLVRLAFSGKYTLPELLKMITGKGGLVAHLGTNDLREVQRRMAEGDEKAKLLFEALAYQVSKEIGACSAVLAGKVDAVVLTGGLAYSEEFVGLIRGRISFIAPVKVFPGEDEMKALADGAFRVLEGEEAAQQYD